MQLVTEGVSAWAGQVSGGGAYAYLSLHLKRGRQVLRRLDIDAKSDDLALLAALVWRGVASLPDERLDEDYLVAGEVLDDHVTDHDAELLVELLGISPHDQVGGMSPEATAVHALLLEVAGYVRERREAAADRQDERAF